MLITATNELKFHQWPEDGPEEPYNLSINAEIVSLSCSSDSNYMVYLQEGGKPEILNLRDINNIKPIQVITAIDKASVVMFQKCTKRCVAIGTASSTVALYDTKNKTIGKLFALSAPVMGLDFNADDEYLVVACRNGIVSLVNVVASNEVCTYNVGSSPLSICFHPTNRSVFGVGTKGGSVFIFDVHEINPAYVAKSHFGGISGLAFSTKEDILISGGGDSKFCIHDLRQNAVIFSGHLQYPITSLDISPDGKHLGIGSNDGSISIYDTKNYMTPITFWTPHSSKITFIKFSGKPDGNAGFANSASSNHSNVVYYRKDQGENEFKSLYNKYINKKDDDDTLKLLREDIVSDIKRDAEQLHTQMNNHMSNLHDFIKKEFDKMSTQMEDKWDLLNMVSGNCKSDVDLASEKLFDTENPIVIE